MENFLVSLLLLDVNKTDMELALCLYLLYLHKDTENGKVYKVRDIGAISSLASHTLVKSLNNLVDVNVLGKLVFEDGIVERKVARNFDDCFLATLEKPNQGPKEAIKRIGYYIIDDESIYVLNPIFTSWKYPTWRKIGKKLKALQEAFKNDLIEYLIKNIKNGRLVSNKDVNGWNIKDAIGLFAEKYKVNYNATYTVDWQIEYRVMKKLLIQLNTNNLPNDKLEDFFDYAFKKVKSRKQVLHIANLKYYANEYLANIIKRKENVDKKYYDEFGNLRKVKEKK